MTSMELQASQRIHLIYLRWHILYILNLLILLQISAPLAPSTGYGLPLADPITEYVRWPHKSNQLKLTPCSAQSSRERAGQVRYKGQEAGQGAAGARGPSHPQGKDSLKVLVKIPSMEKDILRRGWRKLSPGNQDPESEHIVIYDRYQISDIRYQISNINDLWMISMDQLQNSQQT